MTTVLAELAAHGDVAVWIGSVAVIAKASQVVLRTWIKEIYATRRAKYAWDHCPPEDVHKVAKYLQDDAHGARREVSDAAPR
jgi:hypothetical protein